MSKFSSLELPVVAATSAAGAVTSNNNVLVVTTEALTTAAAANYTLTVTNSKVKATSMVQVTVGNGTNSAGSPHVLTVTPAAGSLVIVTRNDHASAALNGTLKFHILILNSTR